jgi:hypothetical protein
LKGFTGFFINIWFCTKIISKKNLKAHLLDIMKSFLTFWGQKYFC